MTLPDGQKLTHSQLACFRACPRRHQLRYEFGLRPMRQDLPLRIGSGFARAVEADAKGLDVVEAMGDGLADPYDLALVAAMFATHRQRWEGQSLAHVHAELDFDVPLRNPATGASTPVFTLAGKIDRIVRLADGRLAIMEYKTTSRDFASGSDYWLRLHLDMQLSIYLIAARALGIDVSTILYDVTRRPSLRPSQIALLDEEGSKIVVGPDGARVKTKDGKKWRESGDAALGYYVVQTRVETPDEFSARVTAKMAAEPDQHFARIEIARVDDDLADAQAEIWAQQLALREAQRSSRWYRNPEACFGLNTRCEFADVCSSRGLDTYTPDGFDRVDDVHPELGGIATDGGHPVHATAGQAALFE